MDGPKNHPETVLLYPFTIKTPGTVLRTFLGTVEIIYICIYITGSHKIIAQS